MQRWQCRRRWGSSSLVNAGMAVNAGLADYVLVDMFAEAVTGQRSTEDAIRNAERRLSRAYR